MKRLSLLAAAAFIFFIPAVSSEIEDRLDRLISEGNRAYENSQPSLIRLYADSIFSILESAHIPEPAKTDYNVSMMKLCGNYYYETSDLIWAEFYYDIAKGIIDKNQDVDFHGNDLLMLRELAQLYYRKRDFDKALEVMTEVDDRLEYNMPYRIGDSDWLLTKMTYAMTLARTGRTDEAIDIAVRELDGALDKKSLEYAKARRMYGKILLLSQSRREGALKAYRDYFKKQQAEAMNVLGSMDSRQRSEYWQTLQPFMADCYLLEDEDPGFLYDLTLFSKGLLLQLTLAAGDDKPDAKAMNTLRYSWRDIQKRIKPGEAAVEFIRYGDGDDLRMAALVLGKKGAPGFIRLASPAEVDSLAGPRLTSADGEDKNELLADTTLHRMVWTPDLLGALKGVDKVYFAPDGYIHTLGIEYMPPVENLDLCRLTSTRRLMETPASYSDAGPLLAFGSIDYYSDFEKMENADNDPDAYSCYRKSVFPNLAVIDDETKEIIEIRDNPSDSRFTGADASEMVFRELAPQFSSIILSTHGGFSATMPVGTDIKPVTSDNSMSRHIVSFSGVNKCLRYQDFDAANNFDGLLSAHETATLDLGKCRLFTASACQSGRGEITADGIFGFQRGLKNAGVGAMLLSLWNVNSKSTAHLMRFFYRNLHDGMPLRKAFKAARKELMEMPPEELEYYELDFTTFLYNKVTVTGPTYEKPRFADAFILIDALD